MSALLKFLRLQGPIRTVYVRAILAVTSALQLVRLGPYARLKHRIETVPKSLPAQPERPSREVLTGAVHAVARRVPGASCLVQAVAAQDLLALYGYASNLRVGVAIDDGGTFSAHAWLEEENGTVLIGGRTSPAEFAALKIPNTLSSGGPPPA